MADLTEVGPIFRAAKRRKVFRSRTDGDDDVLNSSTTSITQDTQPDTILAHALAPAADHDSNDAPGLDLLRQRRLLKARRGGIAFNQEQPREKQSTSQEVMLAETPSAYSSAVSRFAAETGQRTVSNDNVMLVSSYWNGFTKSMLWRNC